MNLRGEDLRNHHLQMHEGDSMWMQPESMLLTVAPGQAVV